MAKSLSKLSLVVLALSLLSLGILWWLTPVHGIVRTHTNDTDYHYSGRWLWLTIDGDSFSTEDGLSQVNRAQHEGNVFVGQAGTHTWRIEHSGNVTITIDDAVVFQREGFNALSTEDITFDAQSAWVEVQIDSIVDINTARTVYPYTTEMRLYSQEMFGRWEIIPYYRLYPDTIPNTQAQQNLIIGQVARLMMLSSLLAIVGLGCTLIWHNRHQRYMWVAFGITLLSLSVRLIVWWQRASNDPLFSFLVPAGDDNYVLWGQQWLSGQYQLAGTFWPPTPIVFNALIVIVFGSQLWKIMIANIVLSAMATGIVTLSGWIAFAQKRIGIIAGLIFALFSPLVLYQTTSQSVVLDATFISFAMCAGFLAIKHESFGWSALFGFWISIAGMSRGTALLLGLAFFFALLMRHRQRGIQLTVIAGIVSVMTLMPQIIANASATGHWSLVPYSNGSLTLYSGNNRDANGLWTGRGMAWEVERLSGEQWDEALIADFRDDPIRMIELNVRKFAMFWNNIEYVSNVNFFQQGMQSSSLIAFLSQGHLFRMLLFSVFVWIGIGELVQRREREAWFIVWSIVLLVLGTILFVIAGRLRVPVMPFLVLSASVGINALWEILTKRQLTVKRAVIMLCLTATVLTMSLIEFSLPRKNSDSLSMNAMSLDTSLFDEVSLIAHEPLRSDFRRGGYVYLTLYWQLNAPASEDYRMFIELADENGRVIGMDRQLGDVSYPIVSTTDMTIGHIYEEGYLLRIPDDAPDVMTVNVGLYPPNAPDNSQRVSLFQLGVLDADTQLSPQTAQYYIGDALAVTAFQAPQLEENQITVDVTLQANQHIPDDWVIFTHVFDDSGTLIAQNDSPFITATQTVSAFVPNLPITMQRVITLPDELASGQYQVRLGAYQRPTITPLTITDAIGEVLPDNVIELSSVTVR